MPRKKRQYNSFGDKISYNHNTNMYGTDYEISVIDEWEQADSCQHDVLEPVVIDSAKVEKYAYSLIADEISMADVPADYQEPVKELRLKILRGE